MTLSGRKAVFWAWSVLAAIFAHALIPHADPVARTSGSAFSSATYEVGVLRGAQTGDIVKRKQMTAGDPPVVLAARALVAVPPASRPSTPLFLLAGQPVHHDPPFTLPPARGPPTAS